MKVLATKKQRWILYSITHGDGFKVKDDIEGRRYRKFNRAFGLDNIRRAILVNAPKPNEAAIPQSVIEDSTPEVFDINREVAEYAKEKLFPIERLANIEDEMGPLYDALDDVAAARDIAEPSAEFAAYNAATDFNRWIISETNDKGPANE